MHRPSGQRFPISKKEPPSFCCVRVNRHTPGIAVALLISSRILWHWRGRRYERGAVRVGAYRRGVRSCRVIPGAGGGCGYRTIRALGKRERTTRGGARMRNASLWEGERLTLEQAKALTIESLQAYSAGYRHWAI